MSVTIQYKENNGLVTLFWEVDDNASITGFNVYWSPTNDTPGTYVLVKSFVPNYATFGKKCTSCSFHRSTLGLEGSNSFYVAVTALSSGGLESDLSTPRFIPYLSDQPSTAGSIHSPITGSQRYQLLVGTDPVRQKFSLDLKQLEVFNFSKDTIVFLDMTGLDANVGSSMPLMPYGYYSIGRNLSKDTGVSFIAAPEGSADVRIVAHF